MTIASHNIDGSDGAGAPSREDVPCAPTEPPLPAAECLFVWDFDWTIVNCNSDEYVPASFLGDDATNARLREMLDVHGPTRWHQIVSALVNACVDENDGCSAEDVTAAASNMPYLSEVREALRDVDSNPQCGQAIISDGNDSFIGAFAKRNGMECYFTHGVETNLGRWESNTEGGGGRRFGVVYQSSKYGGHSCPSCPPNLCKTQVLRDILRRTSDGASGRRRPRIVYVGDGHNDACPAINVLDEGDVLLARDGRRIRGPNSKSGEQPDVGSEDELAKSGFQIVPTLRKAEKDGMGPRCRVCTWNSGRELRELVGSVLAETCA